MASLAAPDAPRATLPAASSATLPATRPAPARADAPDASGPSSPVRAARSLREIEAVVGDELGAFREHFRRAMRSDVRLLDLVTRFVLRQKGKQMRPLLVLLSAKAAGGITEGTHRAAALVELLHTATLVHDDVVDDAERRRGFYSVSALWKRKVAVLFGDFLLSRGLLLALDAKDYDTLHLLSDAIRRMSEGELLQIEKTRHLDLDEPTYFRIISDKTASLISACTASGARSAGADDATVARMRAYGESLGLAFQIRDDLFDYGLDDVGKPLGIDVQEKKLTLPLIYALREGTPGERRDVLALVRKKSQTRADARRVADFAVERGGLDYARTRMRALADDARGHAAGLPPSPAREALIDLVTFAVERRT